MIWMDSGPESDEASWATPSNTVVDSAPSATPAGTEELDRREHSGIDVRLLWHPGTGATWIRFVDEDGIHSFPVSPDKARDAFLHPFAYEP